MKKQAPAAENTPEQEIAVTEHPLILFDGQCHLCNASVGFILRRDRRGLFRFATLQGDYGRSTLARFGFPATLPKSLVYLESDRCYTGSTAALRICRLLPAPWRWLWVLRYIPQGWRDAVYRTVAVNRYTWFGQSDTCMVPKPEWSNRFMDKKGYAFQEG